MVSSSKLRRIGEALGLTTQGDIRDRPKKLSDKDLARSLVSNRMGLSAASTGLLINSCITKVMPVFIFPATINAWQVGVKVVDLYRLARETKIRIASDPRLNALFSAGHDKAVAIGVCLKVCTAGVGLGLDNLEAVLNAFTKLQGSVSGKQLPLAIIASLKSDHHFTALDKVVHKMNSGIADWVGEKASGGLLHGNEVLKTETTAEGIAKIAANGNSVERIAFTGAIVGGASELVQPVVQPIEIGMDKYRNHRFDQTYGYNKPSRTERIRTFFRKYEQRFRDSVLH